MDEYRAFSDMYLIASLLSYGYKISRIDRTNPRRQKFFFKLSEEADVFILEDDVLCKRRLTVGDIETHVLSGTLYVPVRRYIDHLREIRSTIHGYTEETINDY